jgi:hypothetical protein
VVWLLFSCVELGIFFSSDISEYLNLIFAIPNFVQNLNSEHAFKKHEMVLNTLFFSYLNSTIENRMQKLNSKSK